VQGVCCVPANTTTNGYCCPAGSTVEGTGCNYPPMWRETSKPKCGTSGLVPRGAFAGDDVCVPTWVRDQANEDNNAAPSRVDPEGGCIKGYVWREARPGDHVCVTPPTRARTRADNRNAISQPLQPPDSTQQQVPPGEFGPRVLPPSNCPGDMRDGRCISVEQSTQSPLPGEYRSRVLPPRVFERHPPDRGRIGHPPTRNTQRFYRPPARHAPVSRGRRR
jgi:hypothetical protein